jgi:hypothetical protein
MSVKAPVQIPLTDEDRQIFIANPWLKNQAFGRYAIVNDREGYRISNRLDWRAKSVLGASVVQQVASEIRRAHDWSDSREWAMQARSVY